MENLNAGQVKSDLAICALGDCQACHYNKFIAGCRDELCGDALALINSQEQRIGELEAECKQWRSDWAKNQKRWEIAYDELDKEKHDLELTLVGVMFSVDKWLDGAELEQDEVNRAITMREKTLQIVEKLTEENERLRASSVDYRNIPHIRAEAKADAVRKMQERVLQLFPCDKKFTTISRFTIDEIAKEMLEGVGDAGE